MSRSLPDGCSILSSQKIDKLNKFDYSGPGLEFIVATPRGQRRVTLAMVDPEAPETLDQLSRSLEVMRDDEERRALEAASR